MLHSFQWRNRGASPSQFRHGANGSLIAEFSRGFYSLQPWISAQIARSHCRQKGQQATFALWMIFLLGRQAMLGQEPPTYFRSITATFIPFLARVQERSLPAAPLPRMSRSYSSALIVDAALPLVAGLCQRPPAQPEA